jgi:hypothetical protein
MTIPQPSEHNTWGKQKNMERQAVVIRNSYCKATTYTKSKTLNIPSNRGVVSATLAIFDFGT